jgi:very-short-patch-repair endonuclease
MIVVDLMLAEAFEAEENFRIGGDEEARQRRFFDTRHNLVLGAERAGSLFKYPLTPAEHYRDAEVLITNWGQTDGSGNGKLFRICHDCGRHCPAALGSDEEREWLADHARYCEGGLADTVLAYRFHTDSLVITLPSGEVDVGEGLPSNAVTLAEALRQGAAQALGLESGEIDVFVQPPLADRNEAKIIFYETVPGGAGYLEDMARRLPLVAQRAHERLFGSHSCAKACYLCLKHYGNQRWHAFLDKYSVRSLLWMMAQYEEPEQAESHQGDGGAALWGALSVPAAEAQVPSEADPRYRRGPIEEYLAQALAETSLPAANREFEFRVNGAVLTVPDFAWEDVKLAVYCDSFEFHADRDRLVGDARKRNQLQLAGWTVLVYWGRLLKRDPSSCAREIEATYTEKQARGRDRH